MGIGRRLLRSIVAWGLLGLGLTLFSAAVPPIVGYLLGGKIDSSQVNPPIRLPFAPGGWPDPNVTWRKAIPGWEVLTSIRGIGIEHMMFTEQTSVGWPMVVARGWSYQNSIFPMQGGQGQMIEADKLSLATISGVTLPTNVRATGLFANALCWSLGPWLIFRGHRVLREAIRRHRKLCLGCGYPAGVSPTCTECGASLPQPFPAATPNAQREYP